MYQAIVFLPLLGAILAGIIALAGAHARHPGGSAPEDAEDKIVGLTPEHPHGAPSIVAAPPRTTPRPPNPSRTSRQPLDRDLPS